MRNRKSIEAIVAEGKMMDAEETINRHEMMAKSSDSMAWVSDVIVESARLSRAYWSGRIASLEAR